MGLRANEEREGDLIGRLKMGELTGWNKEEWGKYVWVSFLERLQFHNSCVERLNKKCYFIKKFLIE